jgi:hypothetical protein
VIEERLMNKLQRFIARDRPERRSGLALTLTKEPTKAKRYSNENN